ncbi:MAG TPA: HD domain-containing protein [Gemmataceae bacterium]|nr:HD domain-containing protein [Gemmataceae bacterium]
MANIEKALQIAAKAHEGQTDKDGQPYILHPLRVMQRVEGMEAQIVAILHDVVEDTKVTLEDLRDAGFGGAILAGVRCVTHGKNESYADYLVRCKANPLGRQVKLADLEDNSRPARVLLRPTRLEGDLARLRKYVLAYKFLIDRLSEAEYRKLMADVE